MDSTVDIVNAFGREQHQDASAVVAVIVLRSGGNPVAVLKM